MTTVPLVMLVAFVIIIAGGPRSSLRWLEMTLQSFIDWVRAVIG